MPDLRGTEVEVQGSGVTAVMANNIGGHHHAPQNLPLRSGSLLDAYCPR